MEEEQSWAAGIAPRLGKIVSNGEEGKCVSSAVAGVVQLGLVKVFSKSR